jgi:CubicO group peptidase (beta-lactamase class C family)
MKPLGMNQSAWEHCDIDMNQFVSLYLSGNQKIPHYSLISYADGGLITNVNDLAIFFSEMIKGYNKGGAKILKNESFKKMMDAAFVSDQKNYGIFWSINGKGEYGHSGGDPGIMTFMMFDPKSGLGRIIFTNKIDQAGNGMNQLVYIWKTLEEYMLDFLSREELKL